MGQAGGEVYEDRCQRRGIRRMKTEGCRNELMRLLTEMPFLDRRDMSPVSVRSTDSVYEAASTLAVDDLVSSIQHGSDIISLTQSFCLNATGIRVVADGRAHRWTNCSGRIPSQHSGCAS